MYSYFVKSLGLDGPISLGADPLEFNKHVVYVSKFEKGDQKIEVTESLIDHWVNEHAVITSMGFKVRLPVEHTFDPEKNRGEVLSFFKARDSKNRISLFARLRFVDEDAAKLARSTDVSLFSPPSFKLGNGYVSKRPITHVALTDYPVVPGLDGFETLAASLTEETAMSLMELIQLLGLELPEGVTEDAQIAEFVANEWKKLKTPEPPKDEKDDVVAASLVKMTASMRTAQINSLMAEGRLTPAEATEWKKSYTTNVSLSHNDGYDLAFSLAQKREPLDVLGQKSKRQTGSGDNPLLADAKRRAGAK
jgi:hypothetical protein